MGETKSERFESVKILRNVSIKFEQTRLKIERIWLAFTYDWRKDRP